MRIPIITILAATSALAACGEPASVQDVEEKLTEDFSEGEADVTWIQVTEEGDGEFTAIIDITDPEEETGSRTAQCSVSQTSMSSSRSCNSLRPSVGAQIEAQMVEFFAERNAELRHNGLQRNDDGLDFAGRVRVFDGSINQEVVLNCQADVTRDNFEWTCNPVS